MRAHSEENGTVGRWARRTSLLVLSLSTATVAAPPAGPSPSTQSVANRPITATAATALPRHILKRFDFDERLFGNVEEVPMYWVRRTGPDLPHYNQGGFDWSVGHTASPALRLDAVTGNVALTYTRNDIPVEPGSRYTVSGWVRTQNLRNSRAYLSAAYLTRDMRVVEQTEVASPSVGSRQEEPWQRVEIQTLEAPNAARFLQITAWLTQPQLPDTHDPLSRPIRREDTHATAWFDDIEVTHLLPAASIRTLDDTPVFAEPEPVRLLGPRENPGHFGLACRIRVTDEDGGSHYFSQTDPRRLGDAPPAMIQMDDLPGGTYTACLQALSQDRLIDEQDVRFARLPQRTGQRNGRIGICLEESSLDCPQATLACLRGLQTGRVKIPVWTGQVTGGQIATGRPDTEDLLKRVLSEGIEPVGVLVSAPAGIAMTLPAEERTIVDLLAADHHLWQPAMALSLTNYADVVRLWQVGQDGSEMNLAMDSRYPEAAGTAGDQITSLIHGAQAAMVWPVVMERPEPMRSLKRLAVSIPCSVRPEQIGACLEGFDTGHEGLWVTVWPNADPRYSATARRGDLARRVVHALASRAETVFVPQPWQIRRNGRQVVPAPTIEYTVVATLSRTLAGRHYAGWFRGDGGAIFHIFAGTDDATLIAWNDQAADPRDPRARISLYLGRQITGCDLRGRPIPVDNGTTQTLMVAQEPVVLVGADVDLAQLRGGFSVEPERIAAGVRKHSQVLSLTNPCSEPISGTIRLRGPQGWDFTPSRLVFSLAPGQSLREQVGIHIPYNEPIGPRTLQAELAVDSRRLNRVTIPFVLNLQAPGVEAYAFAEREGDEVVIRHVLTNRTSEQLSFIGSVMLPSAARYERLFARVQPGQTMVKEYVIPGEQAAGQTQLRLNLREINGSRMLNQMVEIF